MTVWWKHLPHNNFSLCLVNFAVHHLGTNSWKERQERRVWRESNKKSQLTLECFKSECTWKMKLEESNPSHKTLKVLFLVQCLFLTVVCKILLMPYDHHWIFLWTNTTNNDRFVNVSWSSCTVNDKRLNVISSDLQLLLHCVKGDLLEFHCHAHECQQTHLGHVLLVRQACGATRRDH